jgi:hypothetical protein
MFIIEESQSNSMGQSLGVLVVNSNNVGYWRTRFLQGREFNQYTFDAVLKSLVAKGYDTHQLIQLEGKENLIGDGNHRMKAAIHAVQNYLAPEFKIPFVRVPQSCAQGHNRSRGVSINDLAAKLKPHHITRSTPSGKLTRAVKQFEEALMFIDYYQNKGALRQCTSSDNCQQRLTRLDMEIPKVTKVFDALRNYVWTDKNPDDYKWGLSAAILLMRGISEDTLDLARRALKPNKGDRTQRFSEVKALLDMVGAI